jgi:DNA (cytosine-5)-methyltransferase 1
VALLPTPGKADGDGGHLSSEGHQTTLPGVTRDMALLPDVEMPLLGTPRCAAGIYHDLRDPESIGDHRSRLEDQIALLPTPTRRDHKDTEVRREPHRPDDTDTLSRALTDVLLPTLRATDGGDRSDELLLKGIAAYDRWGEYGPAIRRWEALTRPAPEPTKLNAKGNPKLSDEFDEWLMGLPAGWITDVPGVTWNETLKACGNGVVWQQCAAALRWLLGMGRAA